MSLRPLLALGGLLAACATVPVENRPAADLDWDAHADVSVIEVLTTDPDGDPRETRVWFVRVDGQTYLSTSNSRWLANIRRDPEIRVRVDGVEYPQRAEEVDDPSTRAAVGRASSEKYGLLDRFVGLVRLSPPNVLRLQPR